MHVASWLLGYNARIRTYTYASSASCAQRKEKRLSCTREGKGMSWGSQGLMWGWRVEKEEEEEVEVEEGKS